MRRFPTSDEYPIRLVRDERIHESGPLSNPLATLEHRLTDGYARIEHARAQGQDVSAWEDFWIDLLHQYEAAVNALPEAA